MFSCSTELNIRYQLRIKIEILKIKDFSIAFKLSAVAFILLIKVKMPTNVGKLTFLRKIKWILSCI